jgi:hypothetical protein
LLLAGYWIVAELTAEELLPEDDESEIRELTAVVVLHRVVGRGIAHG